MIYDYANYNCKEKVGKQINILNATLDARLPTGDRVNSTLFPISNFGNTLTIRKVLEESLDYLDFYKIKKLFHQK